MGSRTLAALCVIAFLLGAAATRAGAAPPGPEELRKYFERGMLRTFSTGLTALLEKVPESASGHALLAELRLREENWTGAEAAARRAVELDRESTRGWMLWARARFEQGREAASAKPPKDFAVELFAQAETGFRQVREIYPDHPEVLWWIGWTREWRGEYGPARQFYEAHSREYPRLPGGYRRLGHLLANQAARADEGRSAAARKLLEEALETFDRGLTLAGEDAEALCLRALALESAGERAKALSSFRRAALADPSHPRVWSHLQKRMDPVEELLPFAIEVLGKHPAACWPAWWAGFHTVKREPAPGEKPWTRYELALRYTLPALERNGDHEELFNIASRAASVLIGKTPKTAPNGPLAVKSFERIHDAYAWSGDAANNLGFWFREVRKYELSLAWYLKACDRAPKNQDILNDTGLMYLFHFPREKGKGLPYFLDTVDLVREGDQKPERGYWDALENLCKHYWEVDRQPEKVVEYARLRYLTTKGVKPYNMSRVAAGYAARAKKVR